MELELMKKKNNRMKKSRILLYTAFFSTGAYLFASCSENSKSVETKEHEHAEKTSEHHEHSDTKEGNSKKWTPTGSSDSVFESHFHFVAGSKANLSPEVKEIEGDQLVELTADGTPTAFVLHASFGNVGLETSLKNLDFQGNIKLVHHWKNLSNYEFVSIEGNTMHLGRVIEGKPIILDKGEFKGTTEWMALKVTATGTHYKGSVDEKSITHGHGEEMEKGYVGLMFKGTGKIQIKSIEATLLESE